MGNFTFIVVAMASFIVRVLSQVLLDHGILDQGHLVFPVAAVQLVGARLGEVCSTVKQNKRVTLAAEPFKLAGNPSCVSV